jgi:hypothetical protein
LTLCPQTASWTRLSAAFRGGLGLSILDENPFRSSGKTAEEILERIAGDFAAPSTTPLTDDPHDFTAWPSGHRCRPLAGLPY